MVFGALPPEINSGRMYSGSGSAPMLDAAVAWDGLGAELRRSAASLASVVSGLAAERWMGPASATMAAATMSHVRWLHATAAITEHTATQARAAVAAYENAFAMTVHPQVIANNRIRRHGLIATNVLGQNAPAIAATEAHYGQIWAQDAEAMYTYAATSTQAVRLTPFVLPGLGDEEDAETPSGISGQTTTSRPAAAVAKTAPESALTPTPPAPSPPKTPPPGLMDVWQTHVTPLMNTASTANWIGGIPDKFTSFVTGMLPAAVAAEEGAAGAAVAPALNSLLGAAAGGGPVAAGLGKAGLVGGMSVPTAWATAAPSAASAALPLSGLSGVAEESSGNLLRGIPLSGAGRRSGEGFMHRYGFRHSVVPRPPAAG